MLAWPGRPPGDVACSYPSYYRAALHHNTETSTNKRNSPSPSPAITSTAPPALTLRPSAHLGLHHIHTIVSTSPPALRSDAIQTHHASRLGRISPLPRPPQLSLQRRRPLQGDALPPGLSGLESQRLPVAYKICHILLLTALFSALVGTVSDNKRRCI